MANPLTIPVTEQRRQNIIQAVRDYGKRLFQFIRKRVNTDEDAEDILQDVWYRFTSVMNIEPIEQTSAWLFRVARNRIIDQYKRHTVNALEMEMLIGEGDEISITELLLTETPVAETDQLRNFFWQQLLSALNELPDEQRLVFTLNELEGISFNEISKRTGEKVSTLISRKRYAVLHLRRRLEQVYKEIIEQ